MADLEFRDEGWSGLTREIVAQTVEDATAAVGAAAKHIHGAVVEKLAGQRSGRIYRVPGTSGATHQASAPGEPPAVMLGDLRKYVNASTPKVEGPEVRASVGVDGAVVPYARRLELGGRDSRGVFIARRPYLISTFLEQETRAHRIMQNIVGTEQ